MTHACPVGTGHQKDVDVLKTSIWRPVPTGCCQCWLDVAHCQYLQPKVTKRSITKC